MLQGLSIPFDIVLSTVASEAKVHTRGGVIAVIALKGRGMPRPCVPIPEHLPPEGTRTTMGRFSRTRLINRLCGCRHVVLLNPNEYASYLLLYLVGRHGRSGGTMH